MRPPCTSRSVSSLRRFSLLSLLTGIAGLATLPAFAQADVYPSKPITLVVGYPPGGSTDLTGRVLGAELAKKLGVELRQSYMRRDNQDGNPATIRMRMRRCRGDEGRA